MSRPFTPSSPAVRGSMFYFALFAALGSWIPFLSVYFHNLGLRGWQIGLLSAFLPAATFLLAPPLAMWSDRHFQHLTLLSLFLLGLGASLALFLLSERFWVIVLFMAILAVFYSPVTPIGDTIVSSMARHSGLNYGGMRLWGSLGYAAMAILGGAVWQHAGYSTMFVVSAVLYLIVAISVWSLQAPTLPERHEQLPLRTVLRDSAVLTLLTSTLLIGGALGIDITFTSVYMQHLGGNGIYIGLAFGLSALFELPTMRYSAPLARRIGGRFCLLIACGLFATAYIGYVLSPSPAILVIFSIFRGLAFGLFYASTVRLLSEMVPKHWAATIQGIMNGLAFGLAQLLSRPLGGIIYDSLGPPIVFVAATALVTIAAGVIGRGSTLHHASPPHPLSR